MKSPKTMAIESMPPPDILVNLKCSSSSQYQSDDRCVRLRKRDSLERNTDSDARLSVMSSAVTRIWVLAPLASFNKTFRLWT